MDNSKKTYFSIAVCTVMIAISVGINMLLAPSASLYKSSFGGVNVSSLDGKGDFSVLILRRNTTPKGRTAPIESFLSENGAHVLTLSYPPDTNPQELVAAAKNTAFGEKLLLLSYENSWAEAMEINSGIGADAMVFISPVGILETSTSADISTLLIGTTTDTHPTHEELIALYNSISGDNIRSNGLAIKAESGNYRLRIVSSAIDAYEAYSSQLMSELATWTNSTLSLDIATSSPQGVLRPISWLLGALGVVGMLISLYYFFSEKLIDLNYAVIPVNVIKKSHYAASKALMWIATLPILMLLLIILWLLPIQNVPVIGVLFSGYLGCYGLAMGYLYKSGKVKGISGTFSDVPTKAKSQRILLGIFIELLIISFIYYLGSCGLYTVNLTIDGIYWFVFYMLMSYLGIQVILSELLLLDQSKMPFAAKTALTITPFVPYVALAVIALPAYSFTQVLTVLFYISVLVVALLLAKLVQLITGIQKFAAISGAIIVAGFIAFTTL